MMSTDEDDPFSCFDDSDNDDGDHDAVVANDTTTKTTTTISSRRSITSQRDDSCGILAFHQGTEIALLNHVKIEFENNIINKKRRMIAIHKIHKLHYYQQLIMLRSY